MINPNELVRVPQANTRKSQESRIHYDLAFSPKTEKFRVSPGFHEKSNLETNGLTLYEDPKNNRLILATEPNEQAVMLRGVKGKPKGREFTSSRMRFKLNHYGFHDINEFTLKEIGENEGITYFEIASDKPKSYSSDAETTTVDNIPGQEASGHPDIPETESPDVPDSEEIGEPDENPKEGNSFEDQFPDSPPQAVPSEDDTPNPTEHPTTPDQAEETKDKKEPADQDNTNSSGEPDDDDLDKLLG